MKLSKKLAALAAVGLVAGVLLAVSSNAANANTGDQKVTVTYMASHPDQGNHGVWALDTFSRTVTITEGDEYVPPTPVVRDNVVLKLSYYTATVKDKGTFLTLAGAHLSPARGENLVGNLDGWFSGSFTVKFVALANFSQYQGNYANTPDAPYTGTQPAKTDNFVKGVWGGADFQGLNANGKPTKGGGALLNASWTYKTCNETWVDADSNDWGTDEPGAGDITGATECPSPSPTPSATTASPTPTPTPTTTVAPTPSPVTQTVTVTG